jgi:hypothetical protein
MKLFRCNLDEWGISATQAETHTRAKVGPEYSAKEDGLVTHFLAGFSDLNTCCVYEWYKGLHERIYLQKPHGAKYGEVDGRQRMQEGSCIANQA